MLGGDALFVGDVGRPDLSATISAELSADVLARQLYHSLHGDLLRLLPELGLGSSRRTAPGRPCMAAVFQVGPVRRSVSSVGHELHVAAVGSRTSSSRS